MFSGYRDGYFKALLDLYNALNDNDDVNIGKSKKKYKNFVITMIDTLLKNPHFLDEWMDYGGKIEHSNIYECYVDDDSRFYIKERKEV